MASNSEFAGKDRRTLTQALYRLNLLIKMDERNRTHNMGEEVVEKTLVDNGSPYANALTRVKNRLIECLAMRKA